MPKRAMSMKTWLRASKLNSIPLLTLHAVIPPLQRNWICQALHESLVKDERGMKIPALSQELVDMEVDSVDGAMTLAGAKAEREQLMDERTAFVDEVNEQHFCTEFNFCEH
ncbi:hypothetical protein FRC01_006434 [Tulasnella sp. 417]|nr:hypothetical protein FRC01_006434 [Tulasnella sp. 417]